MFQGHYYHCITYYHRSEEDFHRSSKMTLYHFGRHLFGLSLMGLSMFFTEMMLFMYVIGFLHHVAFTLGIVPVCVYRSDEERCSKYSFQTHADKLYNQI